MTRAWTRLVAWTSQREPATALALFRVAVALVILYSVGSAIYGDVVGLVWVHQNHGGYLPLVSTNALLNALGGPTPQAVWTVLTGAGLGALLMLIGVGGPVVGRVIPLVTLQCYLAFHTINSNAMGGYDNMIDNALWLLVLAHSTATLSLYSRRTRGRWHDRDALIPAWPRYLAITQLLVIYGATGLQKISAKWTPADGFSALWWVYQDPTWRRFDMDWTVHVYPLLQLGTAVTWLWETLAPVMFLVYWYRNTPDRPGRLRRLANRYDPRLGFAAIGVALHLGILVTLNVGPFSLIALAYYICLFRPEEWDRWGEALKARVSG